MGIMDFELQRERRTELLREAGSRRDTRRRQSGNRRGRARGAFKLAGFWAFGR